MIVNGNAPVCHGRSIQHYGTVNPTGQGQGHGTGNGNGSGGGGIEAGKGGSSTEGGGKGDGIKGEKWEKSEMDPGTSRVCGEAPADRQPGKARVGPYQWRRGPRPNSRAEAEQFVAGRVGRCSSIGSASIDKHPSQVARHRLATREMWTYPYSECPNLSNNAPRSCPAARCRDGVHQGRVGRPPPRLSLRPHSRPTFRRPNAGILPSERFPTSFPRFLPQPCQCRPVPASTCRRLPELIRACATHTAHPGTPTSPCPPPTGSHWVPLDEG
jgi:hypothetical protein